MDVFNSQPTDFDISWAKSTIKYDPAFMRSMQKRNLDGAYEPN
jgi:hypothetical protein